MKISRIEFLTRGFPYWVLIAVGISLAYPPSFSWFSGGMIPAGLAVIMLGMGLTLTWEDFARVLQIPRWVILGFILQYTIMPFLGWSVAELLRLPPAFGAGLILVGCCPGGTASNVVTYLAKGNVPLSVTMTACSTLMAAFMTPVLTSFLIGSRVEVSVFGLFKDTVQVVLLPVIAGIWIHHQFPRLTQKTSNISPLVAVIFIVLIVGSVIGSQKQKVLESGWILLASVGLFHGLGFFLGYLLSRLWTRDLSIVRTISIEVGMQNSGLGVVLARQNFTDPLTAVPSAISSATHCLIGSLLAAIWRRLPAGK